MCFFETIFRDMMNVAAHIELTQHGAASVYVLAQETSIDVVAVSSKLLAMALMKSFEVEDAVTVHSLVNRTEFNGCQGLITDVKLLTGRVVVQLLDGKHIAVSTANVTHSIHNSKATLRSVLQGAASDLLVAQSSRCLGAAETNIGLRQMRWTSSAQSLQFQQHWVQQIGAMDGKGLEQAKGDVYAYLILKLAHVLRHTKKIGQAGYGFVGQPVEKIRRGCVWSQGGHEQETELLQREPGRWWPIIFTESPHGSLYPSYCPGPAWQNARPWFAHVSRIAVVNTPVPIIQELPEVLTNFA